jgi:hypothetical protein
MTSNAAKYKPRRLKDASGTLRERGYTNKVRLRGLREK